MRAKIFRLIGQVALIVSILLASQPVAAMNEGVSPLAVELISNMSPKWHDYEWAIGVNPDGTPNVDVAYLAVLDNFVIGSSPCKTVKVPPGVNYSIRNSVVNEGGAFQLNYAAEPITGFTTEETKLEVCIGAFARFMDVPQLSAFTENEIMTWATKGLVGGSLTMVVPGVSRLYTITTRSTTYNIPEGSIVQYNQGKGPVIVGPGEVKTKTRNGLATALWFIHTS